MEEEKFIDILRNNVSEHEKSFIKENMDIWVKDIKEKLIEASKRGLSNYEWRPDNSLSYKENELRAEAIIVEYFLSIGIKVYKSTRCEDDEYFSLKFTWYD